MPSEEERCLFCGAECWPADGESYQDTVNLTEDALFVASDVYPYEEQLPSLGGSSASSNFCTVECFAKWAWAHAKHDRTARQLVDATAEVSP